jgi:signal transduction histidine kinase
VLNARENLPRECQPPLRRISATARSMNDILKALLFLAREPRREAPDDERCRLDELLAELIESQPAVHGARHQTLRVVASEPVVAAVAPGPATIVLGNLIRNALQHSLADTIEVRLEADRFVLRDNGRGMTAEAISRAYSERVRDGRNDASGGLGLSIVQRVCTHIGWRLCIDSALDGGGTSIVVSFGATVSDEPRAAR